MTIATHFKTLLYDHFGIGDNPHRLVDCLICCEHGKVIHSSLPAIEGYVLDEKASEAWAIVPDSFVTNRENGHLLLIVDERDAFPCVATRRNKGKREEWATKENISKIATNAFTTAIAGYNLKSKKNKQQTMITMALVLVAIAMALMVLMSFMPVILDKYL